MAVNDLKYRYVKMCGGGLTKLETIFREDKRKAVRNTIRNRVERYETRVKIRAEQLEQATVKERKAYELLQDAEQLRKNNYS